MNAIKIYLILCLVWSLFAFYKQRTTYSVPFNSWRNCLNAAVINFLLFPYALGVAIVNGKIFK